VPNIWQTDEEKDAHAYRSKIYAVPFAFLSINLLISIILTIITPPGSIPENIEWDMPQSTEPEKA
jgi:hypothetical protein